MLTLAAVLLVIAVLINLINVVGRYLFHMPLEWAEEIMIFLITGLVFLGIPVVAWRMQHISMDALVGLLPPRLARCLKIVLALLAIIICVYVAIVGLPVVQLMSQFGQVSESAHIPLAFIHALIPFGFALSALFILVRLAAAITTWEWKDGSR